MKIKASQAQELKNALKSISDNRKANGYAIPQASVLAIAICTVLSGCRSFLAIGEWGRLMHPKGYPLKAGHPINSRT